MPSKPQFKVYQASAGAGKTFTLIKEYLKLCLTDEMSVDNYKHILAITFTNAAANEMKDKIVKALREIIDSATFEPRSMGASLVKELGVSGADLKRNAQSLMTKIMHDYSSFCVCTIDAFVQKLSRSFAHDLRLPSQYSVSIDTDEVAEAVTERIGLKISGPDDYLTRLLVDFSNNQYDIGRSTAIEKQLAEFVGKLTTEKAYQRDEKNTIKDEVTYKQTLDFLNGKMRYFEQEIKSFVDAFMAVERQYHLDDSNYSYGKTGFVSFVRKLSNKVYEQPGTRFISVLDNRNCFSKEAEKQLGKAQTDAINEALLEVLAPLYEFYEKEFGKYLFFKSLRNQLYFYALRIQIRAAFDQLAEEEEIVHISEFNKLLNSVMGDFSVPFVYERIGEHFQHIFVDEFQDTSVLQWQNLLPLVDNGLANGHMSMVVGDGKQSIYRFRSGEVEQITHLPEIYAMPHDEREAAFKEYERKLKQTFLFQNLGTNYRSFAQVVDFNNDFFEFAYHKLSEEHRKVYVSKKPGTDEGVSIIQRHDKADEGLAQVELYDAENQPDYCLERIEGIVRDLVDNHDYHYKDIAVLTRKSELGSEIANYLNDKGIPVISQVSVLLKTSDKVQLLVNTLRYLLHDDNEVYVANVLYYWNLLRHPDYDGDVSHWFDEAKAVAKGETPIETVMSLGEPGLLKAALSKATCIYDLCAALMRVYHIDTIRDAFLNYFMEEVLKAQLGVKEGVEDFLTYWDTKEDKLSVMSMGGDAVKIMTIHKSKGLEFPVVIYPNAIVDLDERLNPSKPAEEWLRPKEDLGFDVIPNMDRVLFKLDSAAEAMGDMASERVRKEKEGNCLDNLNLLYVAFTRAVQRLYVIAKQGKVDKANVIREFLSDKSDHQVAGDGAQVYRFGDPDFRNPVEETEEQSTPTMTDSTSLDWFQRISVDADPTRLWRSESGRLQPREWGERVHEILSKVRYPKDLDTVLRPYLADGTIDKETVAWVRDRFHQMASHPLVAQAFAPTAKVKTECEVLYHGAVKRLDRYAELPEAIYLLDYKTGQHNEKHNEQVRQYAEALREMTDKEIHAFLVYLNEAVVEVELVSDRQ